MLKTLAAKHDATVSTVAARYRAKITTAHGVRTCFEARVARTGKPPLVARFGGIPLKRQRDARINDRVPGRVTYPRKELVTRLLRGRCEMCGHADSQVEVHHVRRLADLHYPGPVRPAWMVRMAKMRRKALVVCPLCHEHIHNGHNATAAAA